MASDEGGDPPLKRAKLSQLEVDVESEGDGETEKGRDRGGEREEERAGLSVN